MPSPAVTLTGTLQDTSGTGIPGKVVLTLVNYGSALPRVAGTSIIANQQYTAQAAANGTFSVTFWGNYQLLETSSYYEIAVYGVDSAGAVSSAANITDNYQFNAPGSFDLSAINPIVSVPISLPPSTILLTNNTWTGNNAFASASFGGPVTIPTVATGDDSTNAASTAFVEDTIDTLLAANNPWTGNETHSGTETFTGSESHSGTDTFTGTSTFSGTTAVKNLNSVQFADQFAGADWGLKIQAAITALVALSPSGGVVDARGINTPGTTSSVDPLVGITAPVTILFGSGVYLTNVPLTIPHNSQCFIGEGSRNTVIRAGASFPSTSSLVTIGTNATIFSAFVAYLALDANSKTNSTALTLLDVQEGCVSHDFIAENATVQCVLFANGGGNVAQNSGLERFEVALAGATGNGVVIQAATSGRIWLRDGTINNNDSGTTSTGDGILCNSTVSHVLITNVHFERYTNGIHKTTNAPLTVIGADGHSTVTTIVAVDAAVSAYELVSILPNGATNALVDTNRAITQTGYIGFFKTGGVSSQFTFGDAATPWVVTPANGKGSLFVQLLNGFTGSNGAILIQDNNGNNQFIVSNDGRITFRGNQSGAFTQTLQNTTLTGSHTITLPDASMSLVSALAGKGVPQEPFQIVATGLTANYNAGVAQTIFTTTGIPWLLRITAMAAITTAATTGAATSTLPSLTLGWTDSGGIARTAIMLPTSTTNTTAVYETATQLIYANTATNVTVTSAGYASNTAAQMTYQLMVTVEAL